MSKDQHCLSLLRAFTMVPEPVTSRRPHSGLRNAIATIIEHIDQYSNHQLYNKALEVKLGGTRLPLVEKR